MEGDNVFLRVIFVVCILTISQFNVLAQIPKAEFDSTTAELKRAIEFSTKGILRVNELLALIYSAHGMVIKTVEENTNAQTLIKQCLSDSKSLQEAVSIVQKQLPAIRLELDGVAEKKKAELVQAAEDLLQNAKKAAQIQERGEKEKIDAEIAAKAKYGIYEQEARIMGQAHIDGEKKRERERWKRVGDPKLVTTYALAIVGVSLCIYAAKYGLPILMNSWGKPRVISEVSGGFGKAKKSSLDDLIFVPSLQQQVASLLARVQFAKTYKEELPNVLFHGAPGTGKTAVAKELAYASGLDYALTSGSEFAKISDPSVTNDELRKLCNWAKKSRKGLIVFIDEAESLFASRRLSSTPKITQDFINTFLSLISDQSQEKLMFIFATNHPGKLDDAITNRIGVNIEFVLPKAAEREKILFTYLFKFAQENKAVIVTLPLEVKQKMPIYAEKLEGFSPRALKFIAQEMIIKARRLETKTLTHDIVQVVIDNAKSSLQQIAQWREGRA